MRWVCGHKAVVDMRAKRAIAPESVQSRPRAYAGIVAALALAAACGSSSHGFSGPDGLSQDGGPAAGGDDASASGGGGASSGGAFGPLGPAGTGEGGASDSGTAA